MIRVLMTVAIVYLASCAGRGSPAATLPDLDPRRTRILELEEAMKITHEQMRGGGEVCADVCRLADEICRAHDDICRLAAEVPDDAWSRGRCEQAATSCRDARGRCDACT